MLGLDLDLDLDLGSRLIHIISYLTIRIRTHIS